MYVASDEEKRKQITVSGIFADILIFILMRVHRFNFQKVINCMFHEKIVKDFLGHETPKLINLL
jgi:hypothetical protein